MAVRPVPQSGWDNRTFRLGAHLAARLPSAAEYEEPIHREQRWLAHLRRHLPLPIPEPLALGRPGCGYPWVWSVRQWLPGEPAAAGQSIDTETFVPGLAAFLNALRAAPAAQGPRPGPANFYRGAALAHYEGQFREAMAALGGRIDITAAMCAWESAARSQWEGAPVWVHGDVAMGNLLLSGGTLAAVIDFGQMCVGDPACDLAIAWTCLRGPRREAFRELLGLDAGTWARGRAWALWKAAIVAAGLIKTNAAEAQACWSTIDEVVADAARTPNQGQPTRQR